MESLTEEAITTMSQITIMLTNTIKVLLVYIITDLIIIHEHHVDQYNVDGVTNGGIMVQD